MLWPDPVTVIALRATVLDDKLQKRDIFTVGRAEYEEIMRKVIERSSEAASRLKRREANCG